MDDLGSLGDLRVCCQLGCDLSLIANQDEAHVRMADERDRRSRNDNVGTVVPAHGVKRYGDWSTHYSYRSGKLSPRGGHAVAIPGSQPE